MSTTNSNTATTPQETLADEMESAAAGYLSTIAGLFRAIQKLVEDDIDNAEVYSISEAGVRFAERGLEDLEVLLREQRPAPAP